MRAQEKLFCGILQVLCAHNPGSNPLFTIRLPMVTHTCPLASNDSILPVVCVRILCIVCMVCLHVCADLNLISLCVDWPSLR